MPGASSCSDLMSDISRTSVTWCPSSSQTWTYLCVCVCVYSCTCHFKSTITCKVLSCLHHFAGLGLKVLGRDGFRVGCS